MPADMLATHVIYVAATGHSLCIIQFYCTNEIKVAEAKVCAIRIRSFFVDCISVASDMFRVTRARDGVYMLDVPYVCHDAALKRRYVSHVISFTKALTN